jgi:hypothetical protein
VYLGKASFTDTYRSGELARNLAGMGLLFGAGAFSRPCIHPGVCVPPPPNVHGFVRYGTGLKFGGIHFWTSRPPAVGCRNRYFACGPRDGLAEDAIAAGSAF